MLNKEPKNELAGGRRSNFSICRRLWKLPLCHRGSTQVISRESAPSRQVPNMQPARGAPRLGARGSEAGKA